MAKQGWIGVDLDGTLAHYDHVWRGAGHIGAPIPAMVDCVRRWLAEGKAVKVFTDRMSTRDDAELALVAAAIAAWTEKHIGTRLEATCVKDYAMIELWDDRAVGVEPNTGRRMDDVTRLDGYALALRAAARDLVKLASGFRDDATSAAADATPKQEQLAMAKHVLVEEMRNHDPLAPTPKIIIQNNPGRLSPSTEGCQ